MNPLEVVEGMYECRKCGNTKIYVLQKQIRSCDETATTICRSQIGNVMLDGLIADKKY